MSVKYIEPAKEAQDYEEGEWQHPGEPPGAMAMPVTPFYTYLLVGALVIVFLLQNAFGFRNSYDYADSYHPLIFGGEYWRLITGAAMHLSIGHAFMNCLALYNLGSAIEYLSNRAHLAIVFLLSVIGGSVLSLFLLPEISSVGASGGIVGLLGYLAIYAYKRRQLLPPSFLKNMLINLGILIAIGVIFYQFIDNAAHAGGLIVGAVYGFIQIPGNLYEDPRETDSLTKAAGAICLAVFLGFVVLTIILLRRAVSA